MYTDIKPPLNNDNIHVYIMYIYVSDIVKLFSIGIKTSAKLETPFKYQDGLYAHFGY